MRHLILIFIGLSAFAEPIEDLIPSGPEEIASLRTDLLIGGYINPYSGQIAITEKDLHIKGAQDLVLQRSYVPPQIMGRYEEKDARDRFELATALRQSHKGWSILSHLWCGTNPLKSRYFQVPDPSGCVLEFELKDQRGTLVTPSYGMSNLNRDTPSSDSDWRNTQLFVDDISAHITTPQGVERIYQRVANGAYRLDREVLPNGKVIRYEYQNNRLSKITSTDRKEKYVYASIDVKDLEHFVGSDGTQASYEYETRVIQGQKKNTHLKATFRVLNNSTNPFFSNSISYNNRLLLQSYNAQQYPVSCQYELPKNAPATISSLTFPIGKISLSYNAPQAGVKGGWTRTIDDNGLETIYRFNEKLLLTGIENRLNGSLMNQKQFIYDEHQHIRTIQTSDNQGHVLIAKHYECDDAGNPIVERWQTDAGTFSIHRRFDQNRLIEEARVDGLTTQWTYLGSTHLITSRTMSDHSIQIRKTTYQYDDACNLIQESEEGRAVTDYVLRQNAPQLHRIEWKIVKDWNGHLIRKIHYEYDQWGNVRSETIFGSDEKAAYTIERTYNAKGELLHETNPLGQDAQYVYDERGHCIQETPFSHAFTIKRTFDAKGRLIHLQEGSHKTGFSYDSTDLLIEKTDYLGQLTKYSYHPVHRKPIRIESSPTVNLFTYDAFGQSILTEDGEGNQTYTSFNAYGFPIEKKIPGGGREISEYALNGNLIRHVDADGIETQFTHDALKRLTSKTVGKTATTIYRYDGYDCIEEINAEGISTHYIYNQAGQKIREETSGRLISFSYDSLGFLDRIEKAGRVTMIQNDRLGRPLERSVSDHFKITYAYDSSGNIASITQRGTTQFRYDSYDRLVEKNDPLGHITTISYEESNHSLIKKITDPLGIESIEHYDPHGCLLKKEIDGQVTQEFAYDRALRKIKQDHLTFSYTPDGHIASITEADRRTTCYTYSPAGRINTKQLPDGQILSYEYDALGHQCRIGEQQIEYDRLGRLVGGSGFYRTLDAFGNILKEEFANGLAIESQYDEQNRPLRRVLPDQSEIIYEYNPLFLERIHRLSPNGIQLYTHSYDLYNNAGDLMLEDQRTSYEYDLLGHMTYRSDPFLTESYEYDPVGNLTQKGDRTYSYDALSQMTGESSQFAARYDHHFNRIEMNGQTIEIDDLNQISSLVYDANGRLLRDGYEYNAQNQLIAAHGKNYMYDAIGRRLNKGKTAYLYIDDQEIGSYESGQCKELQVPGLNNAAAIEKESIPYLPVYDAQRTIRQLIDLSTMQTVETNEADAFGFGINPQIPYAYAGKRFDSDTGLIYFGKRYYDPLLGRWLTQDPAGSLDSSNFYQYVFNNPVRFTDPTGESIGEFFLGMGELILGGGMMVAGGALELVTCGGFTIGFGFTTSGGIALMTDGAIRIGNNAKDVPVTTINSTLYPITTGIIGTTIWNEASDSKVNNPFNGSVDDDIFIGDANGNVIHVPEGHRLGGSKDGKCIEVKDGNNNPIGIRKDGRGHPPGPKHLDDPRAWNPHAHIPGITNPDGTPWLPIH